MAISKGGNQRFWRISWRRQLVGKGYGASITDDLQHDSNGGTGVQCSQHHCFTCVPNQSLPALLCYPWGKQVWGRVRLPLFHMPHASLWKGPAASAQVGCYPPHPATSSIQSGSLWGRKIPESPCPMLLPRPISVGPAPRNEADGVKGWKEDGEGRTKT